MNQPTDHHWHAKFILKKFRTPESPFLCVYNIEKGTFHDQKSPKAICVQEDLLLIEGEGVTEELRYGLENIWSKSIEDEAAPIIQVLESEDFGLTGSAKESLARFITLHILRHPEMIKETLAQEDQRAWEKLREIIFDDAKLERLRRETDLTLAPDEIARYRDCFINGKVETKHKPAKALQELVKRHQPMSKDLARMAWRVCRAAKGAAFITSDNPVVVLPGKHPFGVLLIPLSPKLLIEIHPEGEKEMTAYSLFPKKKVRKANILIGINAKRYLISHSKELLMNIVKRLKMGKSTGSDNKNPLRPGHEGI